MEYGVYITAAGLALTVIGCTAKIVWTVRTVERDVRDDMDAQVDNLQRDVANVTSRSNDREERLRHEFGETASALRTKIHDVETWSRDTFVRKESFEGVIGRIENSIEKLGDKLEARIDKAVERLQARPE